MLFVDADKVVNVSQIETYHPVIWSVHKVWLHYAKAEDLREYLNLTAILGEVEVQAFHASALGNERESLEGI